MSKKVKCRIGKRHFQLLELMVAVFILLVCLVPTMRMFTSMYLSQQEIIRENERDHLARIVHAKFTEKLYKRQINLGELKERQQIHLSDKDLDDLFKKYACECSGTFVVEKASIPKEGEKPTKYLAKLEFQLKDSSRKPLKSNKDRSYVYDIFIDSGNREKKENPQEEKENQSQKPLDPLQKRGTS